MVACRAWLDASVDAGSVLGQSCHVMVYAMPYRAKGDGELCKGMHWVKECSYCTYHKVLFLLSSMAFACDSTTD